MRKIIWILIAVIPLLTGCSEYMEQPALLKEGELFQWKTGATQASETKTTLDGTTLSWVAGDKIGIYVGDDLQDNMPFTLVSENSFEGGMAYRRETRADVKYYAYYPYCPSASPSTTVSAILPAEQVAPFDGSANFMTAQVSAKYDEEDMPDVTFPFNNQLMSIVKLTVVDSQGDFADQKLVGATIIATGGASTTLAGSFTFDVTSPAASPVFSTTPIEVSSSVTGTFPEASQPVMGTNTPHSLYLLVNPITVTSLKVLIKTTDKVFVITTSTETTFTKGRVVAMPTIDLRNRIPQRRVRRVVLWGDSLSNETYKGHVQNELGSDWEVIRGGIGGDTPLGISGRQGGREWCTRNSPIVIPAATEPVEITNIYSRWNTSNTAGFSPMGTTLLGRYLASYSGQINPCYIQFNNGVEDVEIEGTLSMDGSSHVYFTRSVSGTEVTVPAKSTFMTHGAKEYQDADVIVVYMGANGGYNSYSALAGMYKAMRDYTATKKIIAVGFHMGYIYFKESGTSRTYWTTDYRDIMTDTFGTNYVDLKTLGTNRENAMRLLKLTGKYAADAVSFTAADEDALDNGYLPESFQQSHYLNDVHFNTFGYHAMAILVKERMEQLGYLDY